jgi:hypothetical protein
MRKIWCLPGWIGPGRRGARGVRRATPEMFRLSCRWVSLHAHVRSAWFALWLSPMNLASLTARAQTLTRMPVEHARLQVQELRRQANVIGVGADFDQALRRLFADRFELVTQKTPTRLDPAHNLAAGGVRGGALQFHALRQAPSADGSAPKVDVGMLTASIPGLSTSTPLPVTLAQQFPPLAAAAMRQARLALAGELQQVSVRMPDGSRGTLLDKLHATAGLNEAQKTRLLDVLAEIHRGYQTAGAALAGTPGGAGYQDVNWKHTRLELDRVLDVARAAKLTPQQTESALFSSAFSDAVKTPGNFIVHNVHGAQAALHVLGRQTPRFSAEQLTDVTKTILEHQIGPPRFMACVGVGGPLRNAGVDSAVIGGITDKIAHPLNAKHQTPDGSQLAFTAVEKAALAKIGVTAWTVPQPGSRHEAVSRAVIDADSLVNYACPDGWAKLAALHGPGAPPFLQEPRLEHALTSQDPRHASARRSYDDALSVISDAAKPVYRQGLLRTEQALQRVEQDLVRWVARQPKKDVPLTKDGKVPYLTGDLDYTNGRQLAFATRLRDEAVRLLRQQEGIG